MLTEHMPIRPELLFPHTLFVPIDRILYQATWGKNTISGSLTLSVLRVSDNRTMFAGTIQEKTAYIVRDFATHLPLFGIFPRVIDFESGVFEIQLYRVTRLY